jgi:exodeoxyribonuclease VIII|tara:strand:+ start:214 stop:1011 length:798 start_codon:yes stop_codon:yes gene_type:complete
MSKVRLLDNKEHNKKILLKRMYNDNFYYGDLNLLALSSSSIKLLHESPKKYFYNTKYGSAESQALRDGRLLHCLILEPQKFDSLHFVECSSKNTKIFKEAKNEYKEVYTSKEKEDAQRLADALLRNEKAIRLINNSEFEVPMIKNILGYPFRGKADVLGNNKIVDIKTCSSLKGWKHQAYNYGYDIQAYLYCELFEKPFGQFHFLVLDKSTLDIAHAKISKEFWESGKQKVERALKVYEVYFKGKDIMNDDFSHMLDTYYIDIKL